MESPCPPSTKAVTFSTLTFSSSAMKARKRAESSTPAMPITRSRGKPLILYAACAMASSGLETTIRMQFVAAHAGLARNAGGDDDNVGVRGVFVLVGTEHVRVALLDGHGFQQVEPL